MVSVGVFARFDGIQAALPQDCIFFGEGLRHEFALLCKDVENVKDSSDGAEEVADGGKHDGVTPVRIGLIHSYAKRTEDGKVWGCVCF